MISGLHGSGDLIEDGVCLSGVCAGTAAGHVGRWSSLFARRPVVRLGHGVRSMGVGEREGEILMIVRRSVLLVLVLVLGFALMPGAGAT